MQSEIDVIEEALKADANTSSTTLPPFVNSFKPRASSGTNDSSYARNPHASSFLQTINSDDYDNEEYFGEDIVFDSSAIGEAGYIYWDIMSISWNSSPIVIDFILIFTQAI